ncbi:SH3 domain-containing protein [Striga hermonthica]|uniref:SH3 domain-containing protein n=1 Tax=Striga hermonthica TaxID=68872 RepID=A0A9N7R2D7_STRHE|nr:SH3 domain-containing protein [Striga hermonthica]
MSGSLCVPCRHLAARRSRSPCSRLNTRRTQSPPTVLSNEKLTEIENAVLKQFGGYGASDVVADDAELLQHQKLEKLFISTRSAKHFQRDIVRGVEGYIVTGSKQVEIGTKLSEDSRKYGVENTCTSGSTLSKAASNFARARAQMEKERGNLLKAFGTQVEAERAYHQRVLQILDLLEGEMMSERQRIEAAPAPIVDTMPAPPPPSYEELNGASTSPMQNGSTDCMGYFLGEVLYSYQAESDVELNLSIGDYVVVRKVSNNGWAEGECKGKAGWFPFGYIERRDRVLASKVAEVF